jgi:nucleotide-binding universal stress UspA family protein
MFKKILIANDGSDGAQQAFDRAVDLAVALGAELHMICVEENLPRHAQTMTELREAKSAEDTYFAQLASQCTQRAGLRGVKLGVTIRPGHEVETIVNFAREGQFDLLVVGFMGHSRVFERIWGGTSQNLTRIAHCSVLVVK